jgi:voltage-gated potassium channel
MQDVKSEREGAAGLSQLITLILSVVVLGVVLVDTLFRLSPELSRVLHAVDTAVCGVFIVDFCLRFYRAESKWRFLRWGWIDLLASIPNVDVLRWGRLVRLLRILRVLRALRSTHRILSMVFQNKLQSGLASLVLTMFLLVAFGSISILVCETGPEVNIKTAEDAVWWSVTTITTVGYGDRYPTTLEGRILAMTLMMAGVGLFGTLSGLVASVFIGGHEEEAARHDELLQRLAALQAQFDRLERRLPGSPANS